MSIITSHEIARFYEQHRQTEVAFNKQVMEATGLMLTHLKTASGGEIRCILFACSMSGAKLLVAELSDRFFLQHYQGLAVVGLYTESLGEAGAKIMLTARKAAELEQRLRDALGGPSGPPGPPPPNPGGP